MERTNSYHQSAVAHLDCIMIPLPIAGQIKIWCRLISYTPNGLKVNFFQKRRQESEERLCVRSLDQQSRSGKIGYEKTDIKQT
jgi:hypothetical protein